MIKLIFIARKQHLPSDAAILGKASKYHVTVKVCLQNALKSENSRELKPPDLDMIIFTVLRVALICVRIRSASETETARFPTHTHTQLRLRLARIVVHS